MSKSSHSKHTAEHSVTHTPPAPISVTRVGAMAEVTLPTQMQYFPPSVAARARSYRQTVTPMNGSTFNPQDKIKLVLGTTPGTYLNTLQSYLTMKVSNLNDAQTAAFDKHASCLIERIEVYHAGALLDQVSGVNVLYNTLLDASVSGPDLVTTHVAGGISDTDAYKEITTDADGRVIAASGSTHVSFSLLGMLSPAGLDRYVPIGDAVNGNLEIHIYLAPNYAMLWSAASLSGSESNIWQISNVEYQAQLVEIDAAVHASLMQSINGVYSLPYNSWRHYQQTVTSATAHTFYIATKVSSLSGVVVCMRGSSTLTNNNFKTISARTKSSLSEAQLRIGALNFPLKPIDCSDSNAGEAMIESLKMFGKLGTSMGGTSMDFGTYKGSKFFLAFDTQAYSAASAAVDDGVQAQHGSTYLDLRFSSAASVVVDVYCLFDGMLTVANGAMSAAF